ncbi:MAG: 3'-phosphoesterase [Saprospiraceae bacterium]|uniref:3'-phosphoesterase n=1 Tax=Candidatus Opimibacter skivensis TaxID=2982028 RepID=A0A9D7XPP8_9BACT|nr:3'-phosphoesterase [Candidatus Opimibacter skivensis]
MSLIRYKEKRDFKTTPEPGGGKSKGGSLIFVIQKHAASRLHYDFRLEMEGVLKSWAVPKGPSTDPKTKRLAMMVEDHPYDYKDFEGSIPKGEYGGGTVIVWDQGTYEPIEKIEGKKAQEKYLLKHLKEGSVKVVMHGKKMKGEWALVKTHQSENSWLLIKHKDNYASDADITEKGKSVVSGKTLEQIEKAMAPKISTGNTTVTKTSSKKVTVKKVVASKSSATKKTVAKKPVTKSSKKKA